jgi:uncharacterized protein YeaO (DUF488 family)
MAISIQKSIYDLKSKDDGFRILVMQYWPRGVRKEKIDAWYRELGTDKELIKAWKAGKVTWPQFKLRYIADLSEKRKQALVHELAKRARKEKITLLCGCRNPNTCHRLILKEQIEKAQSLV